MSVFGRGLILAALLCASAPSVVGAAPILLQPGIDVSDCNAVLGTTNSSCSLFSVGSLLGVTALELTFESDEDVALFEFSIAADATFSAFTTSLGLDSILGLFDATTRTLYTYFDPTQGEDVQARGSDIDMFGDFNDQLGGFTLAAGTRYYLALLLNPLNPDENGDIITNGFNGTPDSLTAGFACDGQGPCQGGGGTFTLTLTATPDEEPQQVPEPATFTMVASGALAALVRRRSKKRPCG